MLPGAGGGAKGVFISNPDMSRESGLVDVGQTLRQHEIFVTGGSGFVGKVVLALTLDRYPEVKHLHVLVRPGRYLSAQQRFYEQTLASPALAAVAEKRGRRFLQEKITVWSGEVSRPNFGIDTASLDRLAGRVGLIIHCAGLVDFFPPVDTSFRSNVNGVEHLAVLARRLGAKAVHISTCFVCGEADGLVEETEPILGFYPRRQGPEDRSFDHSAELAYSRERIRQISHSPGTDGKAAEHTRPREVADRLVALGKQRAAHWGWVNTYTYAKSLGEQVLASEPDLDYAIVRPAIVESSLRFPFPGWIEGGRTAAPLVLMGLGGLREWPVRRDNPLEVVPVDLVASAILVVSAMVLNGRHERVYQLGSADTNPILLEKLVHLLDSESRKRRTNGAGWLTLLDSPGGLRFLTLERARARRLALQKRIRRAESAVAALRGALGKTGLARNGALTRWTTDLRTLGLRARLREQTLDQYLPFVLENRYIFESENIRRAYRLITEKDRALLPWDPERIDWNEYWINHQINGIEKWVQPEAVKEWSFRI